MDGMEGIPGIPDTAGTRRPPRGAKAPAVAVLAAPSDKVAFSDASKELAAAGHIESSSELKAAIREEKIRVAKERIEQGIYRVNDVVAQVAQRIGAYIE